MAQWYKIEQWMYEETKLTGNELLIFALIHNYTAWKGGYSGGLQPLQAVTGLAESGAYRVLNGLIEKNLVKRTVTAKGRYHSTYASTVNCPTGGSDEPTYQQETTLPPVGGNPPIDRRVNPPANRRLLDNKNRYNTDTYHRGRAKNRALNYMQSGFGYTANELRRQGISTGEEFYE